jgi:hypothetical protein
MERRYGLNPLDHEPAVRRNLLLLGLWMRATFVGALFAAAGFAALIDRPQVVSFLTALTWIFAGSTFAWLAWQRTAALLDQVDTVESTQSDRDVALPMGSVRRAPASS